MLEIFIQGIGDGERAIDLSDDAEAAANLSEEFFGKIEVKGKLVKLGPRYAFAGIAKCKAKLTCDISLEEYVETIQTKVELAYIVDDEKARIFNRELDEYDEIPIFSDQKRLDLTRDVVELLDLSLPMKRLAPKYRDKSFEDIYPEFSASKQNKESSEKIDERWAELLKLKQT